MRHLPFLTLIFGLCLYSAAQSSDQLSQLIARAERESSLTGSGASPFHLVVQAGDAKNEFSANVAHIEVWWAAPDKWRREVNSQDFSQTAVRNGSRYSETNSSDYLPWWLHELLNANLDPIPEEELKEVNIQPSFGCAKWSSEFKNGSDVATAWSNVCFNPDNTLREVIARTAAAEFSDYRPFGEKLIARSLTIWKGNTEIRATVALLEPLPKSQEQFLIGDETAFGSRLRFVTVQETALHDFKLSTPTPVWPVLHNFPDKGLVTVNIRIGRDGKVHEVGNAMSINNAVTDAAVQQVRTWTFKPYLVDGFPVQVNANLVIPFEAKVELLGTGGATYAAEPALQRIKRAYALSELRVDGAAPFHLTASVMLSDKSTGTYEETWLSPTKWRREVKLTATTIVETRNGKRRYRKITGTESPATGEFLSALDEQLPDEAYSFHEGDWRQSVTQINGSDAIRIARGYENPDGKLDDNAAACWFDTKGVLRARYLNSRTTRYDDLFEWNGKQIARRIETTTKDGALVFQSFVDQIAPGAATSDSLFTIDGVQPQPASYTPVTLCGMGSR